MLSLFNILAVSTTTTPEHFTRINHPGIPLALIALPILGAFWLALRPKITDEAARRIGISFSFSTLAVLVAAVFISATTATPTAAPGLANSTNPLLSAGQHPAATTLAASFDLALTGPAILLVLLTGIIAPACLLASWKADRPRLFNILFLLVQSAALGVFLAKNFFFWFLFWELSLFPAFFLIKLWGGPKASRAAYQFVIYTIGGSAFMLLAFAAIYAATKTFEFSQLAGVSAKLATQFGPVAPTLAFLGILLGLAVKVPMFPFHTWLPDTYAEAPTGVSMFLTAIMAKMGLYGFMIFLPTFFPAELAAATPWLIWLALAGIVFGAYAAMRQKDLKRMVAYSSVNHLGYCLLALFATAPTISSFLTDVPTLSGNSQFFFNSELLKLGQPYESINFATSGFWLQAFNHGLSAAALFLCVGILENRSGTRDLQDFGGVRKVAPVFAALCGFSMFSSLGLPGLNGFVGEFLIFRGVFALAPWAATIATLGLLATAIFLLTFWQKVFHGPAGTHTATITDLTLREKLTLAPLVALMVLFGVWPQLLLNLCK